MDAQTYQELMRQMAMNESGADGDRAGYGGGEIIHEDDYGEEVYFTNAPRRVRGVETVEGSQVQWAVDSSSPGWVGAGPGLPDDAPYRQLGAPVLNRSSTFDEQEFQRDLQGGE